MSKHGISSSNTINRSLKELVEKGLIVKTQTGYRGSDGTRKPNLYALSWLPIDDINQKIGGEWMPKIKGTSKPLRMDFARPYTGDIKYETHH